MIDKDTIVYFVQKQLQGMLVDEREALPDLRHVFISRMTASLLLAQIAERVKPILEKEMTAEEIETMIAIAHDLAGNAEVTTRSEIRPNAEA